MSGNELGHFEHRNLILLENGAELVVGHDVALVLGVLEVVFLDVVPHTLHHLTAAHRTLTHHCLQFGAELHGL